MNRRTHGAALIVTLLLLGFLAVSLAAFFIAVSGGRKRAGSERAHAQARLFTDLAAQEAIAKIATGFAEAAGTGSDPRGSVTASPGLMEIRYFDTLYNRGTERGAAAFLNNPARPPFFRNPFASEYSNRTANPRWIPLFSWKWFAPGVPNLRLSKGAASEPNPDFNPAAVFDINTTRNPFHPGHHYLSGVPAAPVALRYERDRGGDFARTGTETAFGFRPGEAAPDRPVYVQWIPILRDPSAPPGRDNPMIGRYAYWVDVENTKVNLLASTRPLRQSEYFSWFSGESDAEAGGGTGYFEQSAGNPFHDAQRALEGTLPRKAQGKYGTFTADGLAGQGSNFAARVMREKLLGWQAGQRPFVADNSLVDWDYFNGLVPAANGRGRSIAFDDLIGAYARAAETNPQLSFNSWDEVLSLLDPALQDSDPAQARLVRDAMRRVLGASTTIYGYEEERDPLGQPKLDFVKFLLEAPRYAGATGQPSGLRSTELWARLANRNYHRAYYPAAYPSGGSSRSFLSSFNRFAGNGNVNDDGNGEVAVQQMLLNVLEATLPVEVPPHIDPITGLVGMRSVPYVAEVATRARSAIWLLPEALRNDTAALLDPAFSYEDKPLSYYLTNVIVDVALGCVNPDPFASREFSGKIKLDYSWHLPPAGSKIVDGPLTEPLLGRFTALPLPGDKPGKVRVDGEMVCFRVGIVPGTALADKNFAQTLRIRGWEIRGENDTLWHAVPIRHPRAASAPQWWQMAEQGANAGDPTDLKSLAAYQENTTQNGYRAVGWFAVDPGDKLRIERVFMAATATADAAKITDFLVEARRSSFVERVFSRDPALGHRTGNRNLLGTFGKDSAHQKGHFYGLLGHTWRHVRRDGGAEEEEVVDDDGDGVAEKQTLAIHIANYTGSTSRALHAQVKMPQGAVYARASVSTTIPVTEGLDARESIAEIWNAKTGTLTSFFSDPRWERAPLWELDSAAATDDAKEPAQTKDIDVESPANLVTIAGVKIKEWRGGIRGFFAGAPRGGLMTSIGELGFCHSGFANFPIILTNAIGWNEYQLNSPRNGPPMRMLLDLFTPGAFVDAATHRSVSESAWRTGNYTSNSPSRPRRGTWNMNTTIAHDAYMAIREGDTGQAELKKEFDPTNMAARVAWVPSASGYRRAEDGAEYYRGKKLEDLAKKPVIGVPLDRYSNPTPIFNRANDAWVALLTGDFSTGRVSGGTRWAFNNSGEAHFGPAQFTWQPGTGAVQYGSPEPLADFTGATTANAKLLTFGSDGRKEGGDDKGNGDVKTGFLRGRFAADQNLVAAQPGSPVSLPIAMATRFSMVPMRHFVSDLAEEFNFGAAFADFKTALNPRQSAFPPTADLKQSDGAGLAGGHHASGIFANAPVALLANQVSTSANVFTIHVVAQSVKDSGVARAGIGKSGPGYSDPDDEILAESWTRTVVGKAPPATPSDASPRLEVLSRISRSSAE